MANRKKIAIIGTGISGLSCAWALHQNNDIILYERSERVGGHTNTVNVPTQDGIVPVDTGFIVFNEPNYPNLVALFDLLHVKTNPSRMHFSVTCKDRQTEYASHGLSAMFADLRNITRPSFYSMIADILRFHKAAPLLAASVNSDTIGHFLKKEGYGRAFIHNHLIPMAAAIWSCPPRLILDFPAKSLGRFFVNHGLTQIRRAFEWRSVDGGSNQYIAPLTEAFSQNIHTCHDVSAVRRKGQKVEIFVEGQGSQLFDDVIFACHAPQACAILEDKDDQEGKILSAFKTQNNRAILHQDPTFMPQRKKAWSSWNYLTRRDDINSLAVTYWMNSLQKLDSKENFFVTLNPFEEPSHGLFIDEFDYDHPVFDQLAIEGQRDIWQIQGRGGVWYAGAWMGYGFHEDGIQAGLAVAEMMTDFKRPWAFDYTTERLSRPSKDGTSRIAA